MRILYYEVIPRPTKGKEENYFNPFMEKNLGIKIKDRKIRHKNILRGIGEEICFMFHKKRNKS